MGAFVVKQPFKKNAQCHDAADEKNDHQRATPLHHLKQTDFFLDRCNDGLRKKSGDHKMIFLLPNEGLGLGDNGVALEDGKSP